MRYIGRNISKDYSNRGTVYWYKYNKVYHLADLNVQPVHLVNLNNFGTAFVYTDIFCSLTNRTYVNRQLISFTTGVNATLLHLSCNEISCRLTLVRFVRLCWIPISVPDRRKHDNFMIVVQQNRIRFLKLSFFTPVSVKIGTDCIKNATVVCQFWKCLPVGFALMCVNLPPTWQTRCDEWTNDTCTQITQISSYTRCTNHDASRITSMYHTLCGPSLTRLSKHFVSIFQW